MSKRLFVVYGCKDEDEYGKEVNIVFADSPEEAKNLVGIPDLEVKEIVDDGTSRVAFSDSYYE